MSNSKRKQNRSKNHKNLVQKRNAKLSAQAKARAEVLELKHRKKICETYAENSGIMPMPSLIDALANQEILQDQDFLVAQQKTLIWFSKQIDAVIKQNRKINYLPDRVIAFVIPLDYYLPLPNNYVSSTLGYDVNNNSIASASCATNFVKIIPVGKSAIKVSYLIVAICDNKIIRSINLKTQAALFNAFESAITYANRTIGSFQAIPSRHNHFIHNITSFSAPSLLQYFVFNRKTRQITQKKVVKSRDDVYGDIFQSRPLEKPELKYYQDCHIREVLTNDKIFELVSIVNQATNLRCFGRNNDSIMMADKFVEYTLGYFYCEIRINRGEARTDVYSSYAKKDEKVIFKELWKLLGYNDEDSFKRVIDYELWYKHCRDRRNNLTHRFITGDYNGTDSSEALYCACRLVRKVCDIIINNPEGLSSELISKARFLKNSTEFVIFMHESDRQKREKLCPIPTKP